MLLGRRRKLAVELPDLALRVFEVLAQLVLVAFLQGGGDLAVDRIDLLVEGTELLCRVLKIGVENLAVILERFEARCDRVQLAARAALFRLLVHFRRPTCAHA